jgi:protein-disulfide isomerase
VTLPGRRVVWPLLLAALACPGPSAPDRQTVEVELPETDLWTGRPDAPLALIEFGSHGCGGCWRFALEGLPMLLREFVEPGRLRYRYLDVTASPVAALVECRAVGMGMPAARTALYHYLRDTASSPAERAGLTVPSACLADSAAASRRRREAEIARRARVPGTPTFLIGRMHPDGRMVGWVEVGFTSPDSLAAVVRAALALMERQP